MLFHLSEQLKEGIENEHPSSEWTIQAIQNIAQARAQGDHLISGHTATLNTIINLESTSDTTRRVFQRILSEQTQIGNLHKKLKFHIDISNLKENPSAHEVDGIRKISQPLHRFSKNDIVQPTFLVAENLLDCHLYLIYSKWMAKNHWQQRIPTKLRAILIPGGGDTTERLLDHFSKEGKYLTLCLTDSDSKLPTGTIGETAKKCERLKLAHTAFHRTIPVRAAENLLSAEQIRAVLATERERAPLLENLKTISHLCNTPAWLHFPFKDGVRHLVGPHKKDSKDEYWQIRAPSTRENQVGPTYLFPGISSKLLQWTIDHLKEEDPRDINDQHLLIPIWESLSELVVAWTCATDPIRV